MPEVEVRLIFAESEKYTMHVRKFKNFHGVEMIEYLNFLFYIILKNRGYEISNLKMK